MSADEIERAKRELKAAFPALATQPFEITSPINRRYNCIAWAAGESVRWWWPNDYWPNGVKPDDSIDAFISAFGTIGFVPTSIADCVEPGIEKVALYADAKNHIKHAARQLKDGRWSSKLGDRYDIAHLLDGVCGDIYGSVVQFLKRDIK